MRPSIFALTLASLSLASGCQHAPDPLAMQSIAIMDVEHNLLASMLRDDVSTRDAPKPGARFVLDSLSYGYRQSGGARHMFSILLEPSSGCKFSIEYAASESDDKPANFLPAAPFADPAIVDHDPLSSSSFVSLSGSGQACSDSLTRRDLASARAKARGIDPKLALNIAFAAALSDLRRAIELAPGTEPGSRFALVSKKGDDSKKTYTFLERSTGCEWSASAGSDKIISPGSIEPASCISTVGLAQPAPPQPTEK